MTTVKLCVDRSIQDGLFSNWKFGFIFDHGPLDLQPSCTWAFSLGFFFLWGTNSSIFARLNKAPISIAQKHCEQG